MNEPSEFRALAAEIEVIIERVTTVCAEVETAFAAAKRQGFPAELLVVTGYALHNFYTGLEEAFSRIAHSFENEVPSDRWHAGLLRRMTLDIPGVRPAVIGNELLADLDEFRGFRHFFRHSYGRSIDPKKLALLMERFSRAQVAATQELRGFLQYLEQLAARLEGGQPGP